MSYDALFSPIKIRGLELKNRVVMPGMNTKMVRDKHFVDENLIAYHVARAKAGCALNITEVAAVCPAPHAYSPAMSEAHGCSACGRRKNGGAALARRFYPAIFL